MKELKKVIIIVSLIMIIACALMIYFGRSSSQNSYIETLLMLIMTLILGVSIKTTKNKNIR
nr:hypothetical protein BACY1_25880 [Tenacibaculum mesophilum]